MDEKFDPGEYTSNVITGAAHHFVQKAYRTGLVHILRSSSGACCCGHIYRKLFGLDHWSVYTIEPSDNKHSKHSRFAWSGAVIGVENFFVWIVDSQYNYMVHYISL